MKLRNVAIFSISLDLILVNRYHVLWFSLNVGVHLLQQFNPKLNKLVDAWSKPQNVGYVTIA